MAKITYEDKVALNPQPSIANINKVTDTDMNEIKSVVNENAVETGSNANGSWIKYENGIMICSNRVTQTKNISGGYEGVYYVTTDNVNFPETFIANPYVAVTIEQNNSLVAFNMIETLTNYFRGYIWKVQSKSNVTYHINYIAIGRWK